MARDAGELDRAGYQRITRRLRDLLNAHSDDLTEEIEARLDEIIQRDQERKIVKFRQRQAED